MTKTLAMAALLAATAFTPALAQDVPTAAEPTPMSERAMVEMAQRQDRAPRAERAERAERPERAERDNNGGGWQRREQAQPAQIQQQAGPAVQPAPQRTWDGGNRARWNGQGQAQSQGQAQVQVQPQAPQQQTQPRRDGSGQRAQNGWQRQAPAPDTTQPRQGWQGNRNDSWRNRGNGTPNGTVQGQQRPDGQRWNGQQRNDSWRNDRRDDNRRNDGRNNSWNGNNGRNDSWRSNDGRRGVDLRAQYQTQYRGWNRSWSNEWRRDRRYDWQGYRSYNRDLFRADRYYAPYGWSYGYQRYGIGFTLSYLLFDQQYWIDDPYAYRLPPADGPYRWVRYYDDVLLVDLRSGRVVDVIHDFFYD